MKSRLAALRRWSEVHALLSLGLSAAAVATRSTTLLLLGVPSFLFLYTRWVPPKPRGFGRGIANLVTLLRLGMVMVGALLARRWLPVLGGLALLAFVLDGVDGWLAKRLGEEDEVGSHLDMETDAYAALVISTTLVTTGTVGAWVLVAGALRYVFVVSRWLTGVNPTGERRSRAGRWFFFTLMTALVVGCFPLGPVLQTTALAIGVLAVVISFSADFRLLGAGTWHPRALVVLLVLLDLVLFFPTIAFSGDGGLDAPKPELAVQLARGLHLSAEWIGVVVLAAITARTRLAAAVRWLSGLAYTVLLLFLAYHQGIADFFHRPPAVTSDVRLLVHLFHFMRDDPRWATLLGLFLAGLAGVFLLVVSFLEHLQAASRALRWWIPLAVGLSGGGAVWLSRDWTRFEREPPLVQLLAKHLISNLRYCEARAESQRVFLATPPDLRYDEFLRPVLDRKPNVHLLMVEAYGEVLATSDMKDAYQESLAAMERRLGGMGHAFASSNSTSPVHSGTSWLAISSVQTGVKIQTQPVYEALEAATSHVPSLTAFFRAQGYHTMALQPGNTERVGLRRFDTFGRDTVLDAVGLDYRGPKYGWGNIPDQYAFGMFRERHLRPGPEPRFVFFMSVSTHYDWTGVPPYVADWRSLQKPAPLAVGELPPAYARIGDELHRAYFRSVDYELRVLADYIAEEGETDGLFLVLGDHQPKLDAARSFGTPLLVFSRDHALVDRFVAHGFARGLFAMPGTVAPLAHEGVFSLVASILADHLGKEKLPVYPGGISAAGLKR